jgi:cytoskeletal protein CcmA (bactofilin family)
VHSRERLHEGPEKRSGKVRNPETTVLSETTRLSGRIVGRDAEIRGEFEGDIVVEGTLVVGREGRVKASVTARSVVVEGAFEGEVHAESLAFSATACAQGAFWAERIEVREGAVVDGPVNLPAESPAAAAMGLDLAPEELAATS